MLIEGFHQVWWIFSDADEEWAGLRLAHFRKVDETLVVVISGEVDRDRVGVRIWEDIAPRERWRKIVEVPIPTREQIEAAR